MARYARIQSTSFASLGAELDGVYKTEDIGRTQPTKVYDCGFLVQTWRQFLDREESSTGRAIQVIRLPSNMKDMTFDHAVALCFWLDDSDHRYRFMVLDQMALSTFVPSRRTYDYAKHAKRWWDEVVYPAVSSHIDSILLTT